MPKLAKTIAAATSAVAFGATATAALGLALVAPRRADAARRLRLMELARHRYAHRGLYNNRRGVPENSLAAFRAAREAAYGSELDVHLLADGTLAVVHDSRLHRATGKDLVIEELSAADLPFLSLFGTDERIPTLEAVLELYESAGWGPCPPLIVEVKTHKGNAPQVTAATMRALDRYSVPYAVESFDPRVGAWLRANRPDVVRGQLAENFLGNPPNADDVALPLRAAGTALLCNGMSRPDFVAYRYEDRANPFCRLVCERLGAAYVGWTIRSLEDLAACEAAGGIAIFEGIAPAPLAKRA